MKSRNELNLHTYIVRGRDIIGRAREVLESAGYDKINELPGDAFSGDKPISIVFVGGYSAGKSTIIKILTGNNDIAIGVGITTEEVQSYDWNGIEVVDTPGIKTGIRPDHDKKAYNAIAKADILAYVVTQKLFDDDIGNNFRKLLEEGHKAKEMVLIVNKMDKAGDENTLAEQEEKLKSLEIVTDPYKLRTEGPYESEGVQFIRCVFISANSYLDSLEESDPELAADDEQSSNYRGLINALESIAAENKVYSRLATPLHQTNHVLRSAVQGFSTGDPDAGKLEDTLYREKMICEDAKRKLISSVNKIITGTCGKIIDRGRSFAAAATSGKYKSEEAMEQACKKEEGAIKDIQESSAAEIKGAINKILKNKYESEVGLYTATDTTEMFGRISEKLDPANTNSDASVLRTLFNKGTLENLGKHISEWSVGDATLKNLPKYNGSLIYEGIKRGGHFFGVKFHSYGIEKLTRLVDFGGKLVKVLGPAIDVILMLREDNQAEKNAKKIQAAREETWNEFNGLAERFKEYITGELDKIIKETCDSDLERIESQLAAINESKGKNSKTCEKLLALQKECDDLIMDIQEHF